MEDSADTLVVQAPAKVNLTLHIIGKRADGYHDLDSVMQKLDLVDTVTLLRCENPGIQLSCPGSGLPEDESNLVWKAAVAFLQEACLEETHGISIVLDKNIPVAAGLGGGSSDAASVLTGMNRLFQEPLSEESLLRLAKNLGADVPFFVVSHSSVRAKGIGDRMENHKSLSNCSVLLVNPGFSVSTAWVYEKFTLTRVDKDSNLPSSSEKADVNGMLCPLHNDLEAVTVKQYPDLETIKNGMLENGASGALMSGSGPTVFGIFPDQAGRESPDLLKCAEKMIKRFGRGVFITRPV